MQVTTIFYLPVKQRHIDAGTPGDGEACPIAQAIAEAFPEGGRINVDLMETQFYTRNGDKTSYVCLRQSEEVDQFIEDFDSGFELEPFIALFYK